MKFKAHIPLAACCAILAGCERQNPAATTANSNPVAPTNATTLTDKANTAVDATVKRLAETREEAVKAMSEKLATWETKIDPLQTKAEGLGEAAKENGSKAVAGLRRELDQAGTYLTEVGTAGKEQWRELKTRFDETMDRLSAAYDAAAKELQSDS